MQRLRFFPSPTHPSYTIKLLSHCFSSLLTFSVMESAENKLILSCRKLESLKILNQKKGPALLFYLFWQTRDYLNSYTRLDYSILPLLGDLTFLWLCPSLWFSSLLWLSLLWLSFHEALQSCFTNLPALDSIPYYSVLCSTFLRRRQSALTSL